ncbi:MAG: hypothetical protein D3906_09700, partial [Candidatus Electrothrix sp. AUS1_2]|nr:hypothetical protein [Candidatus Electrothrix sp. AUS1_2]
QELTITEQEVVVRSCGEDARGRIGLIALLSGINRRVKSKNSQNKKKHLCGRGEFHKDSTSDKSGGTFDNGRSCRRP